MKYKKLILQFCVILSIAGFLICFIDIHILRGYFFTDLFLYDHSSPSDYFTTLHTDGSLNNEIDAVTGINIKYEVTFDKENDYWRFRIKNEDFAYRYIFVYRIRDITFNLTDSILFSYAQRTRLRTGITQIDEGSFFECGTGLEAVLIRPFEEFNTTFGNIYDLINSNHYFGVYKNFKGADTLICQFYLPVYTIGFNKHYPILSNEITVSKERLLNSMKAEYKSRGYDIEEVRKKYFPE